MANKRNHYLYSTWAGIKDRCYNVNVKSYMNYGGRGITMCKRWRNSFDSFLSDMGERPEGTSIDRIDNQGNYEPSNCKWATAEEQSRNRRVYKTSKTGYSGIRKTVSGTYQVRSRNTRELLGCFETLEQAYTAQQLNQKQTQPRISNTTGYKGITKQGDSYLIRKYIDGKRIYLGNTDKLEDAIALYESGVKKKKDMNNERDESGRYKSKN